jgi:hypothetical protein
MVDKKGDDKKKKKPIEKPDAETKGGEQHPGGPPGGKE